VCISDTISVEEKDFKEILIDLIDEKVIFAGIQASLMREVQTSPSTARGYGPSRAMTEKRTKHRDDLAKAKLIPSILPKYIPPLAGVVSRDSVSRDFDYIVITTYLPKGIQAVRAQLERIPTLNISDYNLGDRKSYGIVTPHKFLTKTKGKKSKIIPQPWTMDIARSTVLNMMKIPHFGRQQKVNACIKLLLSCFHGGYLWLYKHITVDMTLIHRITGLTMQGLDSQEFYPGKAADHGLAHKIKDTYENVEKGT
jgi:hypothetical protein